MSLMHLFSRPKVERARGHAESLPSQASISAHNPSPTSKRKRISLSAMKYADGAAFGQSQARAAISNRVLPLSQVYSRAYQVTTAYTSIPHATTTSGRESQDRLADEDEPSVFSKRHRKPKESTSSAILTPRVSASSRPTTKRKIFVLMRGGLVMQYAESGTHDRMPERTLQLDAGTRAESQTSNPQLPYTLHIYKGGMDKPTSTSTSTFLSRFNRRTQVRTEGIEATMIIHFDSSTTLEFWLGLLRQDTGNPGHQKYLPTKSASRLASPQRPLPDTPLLHGDISALGLIGYPDSRCASIVESSSRSSVSTLTIHDDNETFETRQPKSYLDPPSRPLTMLNTSVPASQPETPRQRFQSTSSHDCATAQAVPGTASTASSLHDSGLQSVHEDNSVVGTITPASSVSSSSDGEIDTVEVSNQPRVGSPDLLRLKAVSPSHILSMHVSREDVNSFERIRPASTSPSPPQRIDPPVVQARVTRPVGPFRSLSSVINATHGPHSTSHTTSSPTIRRTSSSSMTQNSVAIRAMIAPAAQAYSHSLQSTVTSRTNGERLDRRPSTSFHIPLKVVPQREYQRSSSEPVLTSNALMPRSSSTRQAIQLSSSVRGQRADSDAGKSVSPYDAAVITSRFSAAAMAKVRADPARPSAEHRMSSLSLFPTPPTTPAQSVRQATKGIIISTSTQRMASTTEMPSMRRMQSRAATASKDRSTMQPTSQALRPPSIYHEKFSPHLSRRQHTESKQVPTVFSFLSPASPTTSTPAEIPVALPPVPGRPSTADTTRANRFVLKRPASLQIRTSSVSGRGAPPIVAEISSTSNTVLGVFRKKSPATTAFGELDSTRPSDCQHATSRNASAEQKPSMLSPSLSMSSDRFRRARLTLIRSRRQSRDVAEIDPDDFAPFDPDKSAMKLSKQRLPSAEVRAVSPVEGAHKSVSSLGSVTLPKVDMRQSIVDLVSPVSPLEKSLPPVPA